MKGRPNTDSQNKKKKKKKATVVGSSLQTSEKKELVKELKTLDETTLLKFMAETLNQGRLGNEHCAAGRYGESLTCFEKAIKTGRFLEQYKLSDADYSALRANLYACYNGLVVVGTKSMAPSYEKCLECIELALSYVDHDKIQPHLIYLAAAEVHYLLSMSATGIEKRKRFDKSLEYMALARQNSNIQTMIFSHFDEVSLWITSGDLQKAYEKLNAILPLLQPIATIPPVRVDVMGLVPSATLSLKITNVFRDVQEIALRELNYGIEAKEVSRKKIHFEYAKNLYQIIIDCHTKLGFVDNNFYAFHYKNLAQAYLGLDNYLALHNTCLKGLSIPINDIEDPSQYWLFYYATIASGEHENIEELDKFFKETSIRAKFYTPKCQSRIGELEDFVKLKKEFTTLKQELESWKSQDLKGIPSLLQKIKMTDMYFSPSNERQSDAIKMISVLVGVFIKLGDALQEQGKNISEENIDKIIETLEPFSNKTKMRDPIDTKAQLLAYHYKIKFLMAADKKIEALNMCAETLKFIDKNKTSGENTKLISSIRSNQQQLIANLFHTNKPIVKIINKEKTAFESDYKKLQALKRRTELDPDALKLEGYELCESLKKLASTLELQRNLAQINFQNYKKLETQLNLEEKEAAAINLIISKDEQTLANVENCLKKFALCANLFKEITQIAEQRQKLLVINKRKEESKARKAAIKEATEKEKERLKEKAAEKAKQEEARKEALEKAKELERQKEKAAEEQREEEIRNEQIRLEQEAREKLEQEKIAQERLELEIVEKELAEKEKAEKEKMEQEELAREETEAKQKAESLKVKSSLSYALTSMATAQSSTEALEKFNLNSALQWANALNQKIAVNDYVLILRGTSALQYCLSLLQKKEIEIKGADMDWFVYDASQKVRTIIQDETDQLGFESKSSKRNPAMDQYEFNGFSQKLDLTVYDDTHKDSYDPFWFARIGVSFDQYGNVTFYDGKNKIENFDQHPLAQGFRRNPPVFEIDDLLAPSSSRHKVTCFFVRLLKYHTKLSELKEFQLGANFQTALTNQEWQREFFTKKLNQYTHKRGRKPFAPTVANEIVRIIKDKLLDHPHASAIVYQFCVSVLEVIFKLEEKEVRVAELVKDLCDMYKKSPNAGETFYSQLLQKIPQYQIVKEKLGRPNPVQVQPRDMYTPLPRMRTAPQPMGARFMNERKEKAKLSQLPPSFFYETTATNTPQETESAPTRVRHIPQVVNPQPASGWNSERGYALYQSPVLMMPQPLPSAVSASLRMSYPQPTGQPPVARQGNKKWPTTY